MPNTTKECYNCKQLANYTIQNTHYCEYCYATVMRNYAHDIMATIHKHEYGQATTKDVADELQAIKLDSDMYLMGR